MAEQPKEQQKSGLVQVKQRRGSPSDSNTAPKQLAGNRIAQLENKAADWGNAQDLETRSLQGGRQERGSGAVRPGSEASWQAEPPRRHAKREDEAGELAEGGLSQEGEECQHRRAPGGSTRRWKRSEERQPAASSEARQASIRAIQDRQGRQWQVRGERLGRRSRAQSGPRGARAPGESTVRQSQAKVGSMEHAGSRETVVRREQQSNVRSAARASRGRRSV